MDFSTLTGAALFGACIVGIVEFVKSLLDKNWRTSALVFAAAVSGIVLSRFAEIELTALQGFVGGMAASGGITGLSYLRGKTKTDDTANPVVG